jgi:Icc-related predicted phosphoesterase
MTEQHGKLVVAAVGDLHVAEEPRHPYRDMFAELSGQADVLALCGDLTNFGIPAEAEVLAEDLRTCKIPIVAVLGNHDHECGQMDDVQHILRDAGVHFLDGRVCTIGGVGFAGVKGFAGGFDGRMLSAFGEEAIKRFVDESVNEAMRLEHSLRALSADRVVVVLHYAPIAETVAGEPEAIFPFLGSSRLTETIDRFDGKVRAVLHGHAHHGTFAGKTPKGIPVYNCAYAIPKDNGKPYALIEV